MYSVYFFCIVKNVIFNKQSIECLNKQKTNTFGFKPLDLIFLYSGKKTEIWEGICNEIPHQQIIHK